MIMKKLLLFICVLHCSVSYASFLTPPEVITRAETKYPLPGTRQFQGIPSLAVSGGGRLWVTWYAGPTPGENKDNYVVLATSGDDGENWNEVRIINPDGAGPVRAFDPEIWLDPQGRLWQFWAQHDADDRLNPHAGVWAMVTENPDLENAEWSSPRRLTEGIMMCKPTVLSSGRWLLPASTWRKTDYSARVVASDDQGRSFEVIGACHVLPVEDRAFDEHMIVERKDNSLWMLIRMRYGIGESVSKDGGLTWSKPKPSEIKHPPTRFFVRRLKSGNLLLVKHGPIDKRISRSHLTAYVSKDDGRTWQGGLLLDEREGVSYPDGQQIADGTIYITYDFSRTKHQDILMATFTEADVLAGKPVSGKTRMRVPVNNTEDAGGAKSD